MKPFAVHWYFYDYEIHFFLLLDRYGEMSTGSLRLSFTYPFSNVVLNIVVCV